MHFLSEMEVDPDGPQTTEMCRAGLLRSRALRTGWLRSPSRPNGCRLAQSMRMQAQCQSRNASKSQ